MVQEASQAKSTVEAAQKISFVDKAKRLLRQMWEATKQWLADSNVFRDTFTGEQIRSMSVEDFVNKTLNDFAEGVNFTGELSPTDIAKMETPILESKGSFKTLAEAEKWAKENLQGKSYTNRYTGEEISIGRKSINEMLSEKFAKTVSVPIHLAALRSVPDFIKEGIPAEIHRDTHQRGFDVMRLYNAIVVNGELYRVKSTVKRVPQGDRYYTYELQEMELIAEQPKAGGLPRGTNLIPRLNANNSITGAKLLEGVKKTNSEELILPENRILNHSVDGETNTGENSAIAQAAAATAAKLGAPVRVVGDVTEITSPSQSQTKRMRRAKGWYDPASLISVPRYPVHKRLLHQLPCRQRIEIGGCLS